MPSLTAYRADNCHDERSLAIPHSDETCAGVFTGLDQAAPSVCYVSARTAAQARLPQKAALPITIAVTNTLNGQLAEGVSLSSGTTSLLLTTR